MAKQSLYQRIAAFAGSRKFFWVVVTLFVLEAAWIALSGRYPMAFDEDFHLGIIRLYAHHVGPFWSSQPPGGNAFGAVARDPSYLYHWLMSFPYRMVSMFTHDQTIQVLWLRAINIGFFAAGLAVYRQLLLKTGASRAIVHVCLLIFVLVPVVPLLAAQINYDNLLFPAFGLTLLLTARFDERLARQKRIDAPLLLAVLLACLLTSLVKYAFLPAFAAIVIYLGIRLRSYLISPRTLWREFSKSMRRFGAFSSVLLVAAVLVASGLFIERYGINMVRYHTPIPDCSKVLSVKACSQYGPWIRDYNSSLNSVDEEHNPAVFAADWFYGMWLRSFFAVDGPATDFQTRGPFIVPGISAIVFAGVSVVLAAAYGRCILRRFNAPVLRLLAAVVALYIVALWLDGYRAYVHAGRPVAINGRYLIPIFLPVFLIGALAVGEFCKRYPQNLKLFIGGIALLTMLWGGGVLTYILRSNDAWYWHNQAVYDANHAVQHIIGPITPGYSSPTEFMGHN